MKNLIGEKFNEWEVIDKAPSKKGHTMWLCKCSCGVVREVEAYNLKTGGTKSCGHNANKNRVYERKSLSEYEGRKYGRLTAIKRAYDHIKKNGCKEIMFLFRCDCGKEKILPKGQVVNGNIKSCGCLLKENARKGKNQYKHGLVNTRLYHIYHSMKARCYRKNSSDYNRWGARGIKICDEWLKDFINFYKWAMENGYQEGLSIDRIDNSKGYSPENCRWATAKEQANNTRRNRILVFNGEKHTLAEWAEIVGIDKNILGNRIITSGWSVEKALTTPVKHKKKIDSIKYENGG